MPKESESSEQADRKIWGYTASDRQRRILEDLSDVAISLKILEYNSPDLDQAWYAERRQVVEELREKIKSARFHYSSRE